MNLNSDIQLIEAARRGCVESFGILTEQYHSPVKAIAYALLGQHDLAEDVAQEVFVVACQDLAKLKRADRFGPWLAGICRNLARRTHRSQARVTCVPRAFDVQARDSHDSHQLDTLRDALSQLKPGERELIVLRYHDNMSYERIGSVLNISTRAVNSRHIKSLRCHDRVVERCQDRPHYWLDPQAFSEVRNCTRHTSGQIQNIPHRDLGMDLRPGTIQTVRQTGPHYRVGRRTSTV
ncbi:MAG: sigma-70 family RNA polymerase sigma factor [Planctomycetes bacterium]|nr:sigma-70 family RNA polymerase sigma factor [Planctomycetota bacterium]